MQIEIYEDVQKMNESRKQRLMAYREQIEAMTKRQMEDIVHHLTEERKQQGMSQQDIAEAVGMAAPNIARLESCRRIPTMQVLQKYANAVGMQVSIELKPIQDEEN